MINDLFKELVIMKIFKIIFFLFLPLSICISCSSDDGPAEQQEQEQQEPTEEEVLTLEGNYRGTWNSDTDLDITYTDFGITAKFEFTDDTETRMRGEFFATTTFESCCSSGANDGTMLIDLDGNTISTFSFNDIITDCTGTFEGSGTITSEDPFTLEIDFTGNDCDGNHIGQMVFRRTNN